eukprot:TRINITY_DN2048_c0_g2_i1.p1 TRINITY_DN2048_c0_g2~~TRINITY_DN2048_c0_g2_i1.p1  ORF type:complete len:1362 (+),score=364.36 TRINITY_DN2048_c0_g2_i1:53-4138(+)
MRRAPYSGAPQQVTSPRVNRDATSTRKTPMRDYPLASISPTRLRTTAKMEGKEDKLTFVMSPGSSNILIPIIPAPTTSTPPASSTQKYLSSLASFVKSFTSTTRKAPAATTPVVPTSAQRPKTTSAAAQPRSAPASAVANKRPATSTGTRTDAAATASPAIAPPHTAAMAALRLTLGPRAAYGHAEQSDPEGGIPPQLFYGEASPRSPPPQPTPRPELRHTDITSAANPTPDASPKMAPTLQARIQQVKEMQQLRMRAAGGTEQSRENMRLALRAQIRERALAKLPTPSSEQQPQIGSAHIPGMDEALDAASERLHSAIMKSAQPAIAQPLHRGVQQRIQPQPQRLLQQPQQQQQQRSDALSPTTPRSEAQAELLSPRGQQPPPLSPRVPPVRQRVRDPSDILTRLDPSATALVAEPTPSAALVSAAAAAQQRVNATASAFARVTSIQHSSSPQSPRSIVPTSSQPSSRISPIPEARTSVPQPSPISPRLPAYPRAMSILSSPPMTPRAQPHSPRYLDTASQGGSPKGVQPPMIRPLIGPIVTVENPLRKLKHIRLGSPNSAFTSAKGSPRAKVHHVRTELAAQTRAAAAIAAAADETFQSIIGSVAPTSAADLFSPRAVRSATIALHSADVVVHASPEELLARTRRASSVYGSRSSIAYPMSGATSGAVSSRKDSLASATVPAQQSPKEAESPPSHTGRTVQFDGPLSPRAVRVDTILTPRQPVREMAIQVDSYVTDETLKLTEKCNGLQTKLLDLMAEKVTSEQKLLVENQSLAKEIAQLKRSVLALNQTVENLKKSPAGLPPRSRASTVAFSSMSSDGGEISSPKSTLDVVFGGSAHTISTLDGAAVAEQASAGLATPQRSRASSFNLVPTVMQPYVVKNRSPGRRRTVQITMPDGTETFINPLNARMRRSMTVASSRSSVVVDFAMLQAALVGTPQSPMFEASSPPSATVAPSPRLSSVASSPAFRRERSVTFTPPSASKSASFALTPRSRSPGAAVTPVSVTRFSSPARAKVDSPATPLSGKSSKSVSTRHATPAKLSSEKSGPRQLLERMIPALGQKRQSTPGPMVAVSAPASAHNSPVMNSGGGRQRSMTAMMMPSAPTIAIPERRSQDDSFVLASLRSPTRVVPSVRPLGSTGSSPASAAFAVSQSSPAINAGTTSPDSKTSALVQYYAASPTERSPPPPANEYRRASFASVNSQDDEDEPDADLQQDHLDSLAAAVDSSPLFLQQASNPRLSEERKKTLQARITARANARVKGTAGTLPTVMETVGGGASANKRRVRLAQSEPVTTVTSPLTPQMRQRLRMSQQMTALTDQQVMDMALDSALASPQSTLQDEVVTLDHSDAEGVGDADEDEL